MLNQEIADRAKQRNSSAYDIFSDYLDSIVYSARKQTAAKAAVSAVMVDNPELAAHYAEIRLQTNQVLYELILNRRNEIHCQSSEQAVAFAIDFMTSALITRLHQTQQVLFLSKGSDDDFVVNILQFIATYLKLSKAHS